VLGGVNVLTNRTEPGTRGTFEGQGNERLKENHYRVMEAETGDTGDQGRFRVIRRGDQLEAGKMCLDEESRPENRLSNDESTSGLGQ